MMKGKKILITSGGCLEKWDQVRGHTNLAKGTIGKILAEEAMSIRRCRFASADGGSPGGTQA